MASHSGPSKKPSEMRIILLGNKESGKSSSGNTILGSEQFSLEKTGQCEKRQGDVAGRQVTVVDSPGWCINQSLNETSELNKQEIVLSASLCPPGPHGILLVIGADCPNTADEYKNMEEHMQLLNQRAWSHTMILFTHGDRLGGKSIEQYIESEGEGLQRLVELCGNRYHVFNNENRGDDTQVTQLLDKIQEVAGDRGGCFEIDRKVLEETEKKRRTQDEGATQRQMKVKKERESIRSMMGDDLHLSQMRIILLGSIESGKSSSGNTILDSEQFSLETTGQCEKRQGDVGGRHVTVVDTPGWSYNASLNETPELIKQEIVLSASLCLQGPHTVLLVIGAGYSRPADWCKNIEDHMQLLSQTVWSHTMILFTRGDYLGGKSIEQYIESEGEGLQRLVELCGNRYHVFNNEYWGDDTQVTQLLDKIEEVAGDKRGCFEIDRRVLEETEKKRRTQDEGATRRQMKVKKQRESIRSMMGDDLHLSEMRIILLGSIASAKSSSGNTILGSEQFSLERTVQCEKRQGDVAGRQVTVVDTPGWWKVDPLNKTSELIKQQIALSASLCPKGPHSLLLVIRACYSCTADQCKNMEEHMQLLSQRVWSHTMILFTHGDSLRGKSIEQFIESEGEGLQRLVELCGNRYHVFNNENGGDDTQVTELLLNIEEMDHYGTGRPVTPDKLKKRQCEVLFDYVSQREDLLELKVGDIIDFIREDVSGWWFGSLNGKVGLFPSNYVKELEASGEETAKPKAVAASVPAQSKGTASCVPACRVSGRGLQPQGVRVKEEADFKVFTKGAGSGQLKVTVKGPNTSLSLDVIKDMKESQQDQMQKMQSELYEKFNQRQTEADKKHTSLSLDTLKHTKEIEDSKRRQHQLDQDQQELRNQHPVLVGRVKNLAAQFEVSQRELEKIRQRQTEAEKKLTSLALDVTQKATIKEQQQQQKVIQDQQDQINKITDQMLKMQCDMEKLIQKQTEADQKRASEARQNLTHGAAAKKLLSVREQFIQRISESTLHSLMDKLLTKSVITDDEMDAAKGEKVRVEKARHVIDLVRRKGDEASSLMIDMISQLDRNLSDALQLKPSPTD